MPTPNKTSNTLFLQSEDQRVLFITELRGQLSDGHWENTMPMHHWRPWCDAEVVVTADGPVGRTFNAGRTAYNLTSKALLDVVALRMLRYVRLARVYGVGRAEQLVDTCWAVLGTGEWLGVPKHEGNYWDDKRAFLGDYDLASVRLIGDSEAVYTKKDLLRDLRAIQAAMRVRRDVQQAA
jgi:hypothetical protein